MDASLLHPLLKYSQHRVVEEGHCCSILWDLREQPESALYVDNLARLSLGDLSQPATTPPCRILRITCDLFPEAWPIEVKRREGVTVGDVLRAIHSVINRRIKQDEWDRICEKQQKRIGSVFDNRCMVSMQREECRANGVLRVDCLLRHTLFAGLSASYDEGDSFVLTLRRPQ